MEDQNTIFTINNCTVPPGKILILSDPYTVKKANGIPAGGGKIANLFYSVVFHSVFPEPL